MLYLEFYRFFCAMVAGLLCYQLVLVVFTQNILKNKRSQYLAILCLASMSYAVACLLGTWKSEDLGFSLEVWAIAPILGTLSFFFYVLVMKAHFKIKPIGLLALKALVVILVGTLFVAYIEKTFIQTGFFYSKIANDISTIYRIKLGPEVYTNAMPTKVILALISLFTLWYSSIFLYQSITNREYVLLTGVIANFFIVVNDVKFAVSPSYYQVPLSFCAYFVETAFFTLLLIKENQDRTLELEEDFFEAGKAAEIGNMAAQICHDIRNPLSLVEGHTRRIGALIQEGAPPEKINQRIKKILLATAKINQIVTDYLQMMRTDNKAKDEPLLLVELVQSATELCGSKLLKCSVNNVNIEVEEDLVVEGHENRLVMIFMNLISNSADAIAKNEEKWIRIEGKKVGKTVELRFIDSGNGIPEEVRKNLFKRKFTTKQKGSGTGLGLKFVQKVVESYQGSISIDTQHSNTCFLIVFQKSTKTIEKLGSDTKQVA